KTFFEMLMDGNFWLVFILGSLGIYLFGLVFEKLFHSVNKRNTTFHQTKTKGLVSNLTNQIEVIKEDINNYNNQNVILKSEINSLEKDFNNNREKNNSIPIDENFNVNTLKQK